MHRLVIAMIIVRTANLKPLASVVPEVGKATQNLQIRVIWSGYGSLKVMVPFGRQHIRLPISIS